MTTTDNSVIFYQKFDAFVVSVLNNYFKYKAIKFWTFDGSVN